LRIRILLSALTAFFGISTLPSLLHERVAAPISLRQLIDLEIMNLSRNLDKTNIDCYKKAMIEKTKKNVLVLRAKNSVQIKGEETYLKQQISVLDKRVSEQACATSRGRGLVSRSSHLPSPRAAF
jgi:hypothetical protein